MPWLPVVAYVAFGLAFCFVGARILLGGGGPLAMGALFFVGPAMLMLGFYSLDRLAWMQYTFHHDQWVRDGRLPGMYWRAPRAERRRFAWFDFPPGGGIWGWVFVTPRWIKTDDSAAAWLRCARLCIAGWNVLGLSVIVWLMFFAGRR